MRKIAHYRTVHLRYWAIGIAKYPNSFWVTLGPFTFVWHGV